MGPSGCGKSTLLSVLAGHRRLQQRQRKGCAARLAAVAQLGSITGVGCVQYNGVAVGQAPVSKLVGFVPQDDLVHGDLTVRCEALLMVAPSWLLAAGLLA
jgi:ABC-type multidrug transport system ATPase subunit